MEIMAQFEARLIIRGQFCIRKLAPIRRCPRIDSRTLQSTPESGSRAGYDGGKKRKGSKVHMAGGKRRLLLALHVAGATEQERHQFERKGGKVEEGTRRSSQR